MSEFTELYKNLSTSQLFKIIEESEKYNLIAVETAQLEIKNRQLSVTDFNKTKKLIEAEKAQKKTEIKKRKLQEERLKKNAFTFFDTISPIQNGIQTPERIVRLLTLIFGAISIYRFYEQYYLFRYMFTSGLDKWDLSIIVISLFLFFLPIATFLFWQRKKIGWILLSILLTYEAINTFGFFITNLNIQPSRFPGLDALFPVNPPFALLIVFLFFCASLGLICKKNVRTIFKVSEQTAFLTIGLTAIVNLFYIYLLS